MTVINHLNNKNEAQLKIIEKPRFYAGYAHGYSQSCVEVKISRENCTISVDRINLINKTVKDCISIHDEVEVLRNDDSDEFTFYLLLWTQQLLSYSQQPTFSNAKLVSKQCQKNFTIAIPCIDPNSPLVALQTSINIINLAVSNEYGPGLKKEVVNYIKNATSILEKYRLNGFNMIHFLKEADKLNVPWQRLTNDIFQIGHGSRSILLKSSISDKTSSIAVGLAKNKHLSNMLLHKAGIPVPLQHIAKSSESAIISANKIGYPVVVKPLDLDGGVGVSALLESDESVQIAYEYARSYSKNITVEKHIEGNDYRIVVVNQEVLGVLERSPGGVFGNGVMTIAELVEAQNQTRFTATDDRRYLHSITRDAEADRMLFRQNLNWNNVPQDGTWVRLRAAANVTTGGVPREIDICDIHPDNILLVKRISRILRLDIAGIDLIIPDIKKSWLGTVCGVCEVNAQPQLFTTLHKPVLHSLLNNCNGRIPIAVNISSNTNDQFCHSIYEIFIKWYENAGCVYNNISLLRGSVVSSTLSFYKSVLSLLIDKSCSALVLSPSYNDICKHGWPINYCDVVIVSGDNEESDPTNPDVVNTLLEVSKYLKPKLVLVDCEAYSTHSLLTKTDNYISSLFESLPKVEHLTKREILKRVDEFLQHSNPFKHHL